MAAHFVKILNQNGISSVYDGQAKHLIDCPVSEDIPIGVNVFEWIFDYSWITDYNLSIIDCSLEKFCNDFFPVLGKISLTIEPMGVPVKYFDIPEIGGFDVAIASKSGTWSPIRNYPFFQELKYLLNSASITYCDLTENGFVDFECLNIVRKSKIYLGLETGVSHLVSSFRSKEDSLILQSGYSTKNFWAKYYSYDFAYSHEECSPCFLRSLDECRYNHCCMRNISPDVVLDMIKFKLNSLLKNAKNE